MGGSASDLAGQLLWEGEAGCWKWRVGGQAEWEEDGGAVTGTAWDKDMNTQVKGHRGPLCEKIRISTHFMGPPSLRTG